MCRVAEQVTVISDFRQEGVSKTARGLYCGTDEAAVKYVYSSVLKELREQFMGMESVCGSLVKRREIVRESKSSPQSKTSEEDTVFLVDWDDTVMPTTFLGDEESRHGFLSLSSYARFTFLELDKLVVSVLKKALSQGRVVIVTNAGEGWVQISAARYMPMVSALIEEANIEVVSARSAYYESYPEAPLEWKVHAFYDELQEIQIRSRKVNLVVVGDSLSDQYAAHSVTTRLNEESDLSVTLKFVKLIDRPNLEQLKKQMSLLLVNLDRLVKYKSAFDICVST
mmetsp:Transcript_14646/g.59612  ORF Transcript_14646/g.59612 Transcript_14646/m.59612 type:complete len:283 (-) Transcript_14646:222-1070(-)